MQNLPTKLFRPVPRESLVSRARLLQRLEGGLTRKLTLISAPAGYGKSTLLSEWAQQTQLPLAWLSLDAGDNDPNRFWGHFVSAIRMIPLFGELQAGEKLLEQLGVGEIVERETLVGGLISQLAKIPESFVLVLDDMHQVTEAQILNGLFYLLEGLPAGVSGMHLILSTRSDPPWPLARLRVRNQIAELRASDLRFNPEEAARFLNDVMKLALSPGQVAQLERRTEGWAAGLQMAALSIRDRKDVQGFLDGFTGGNRFVLDYLMEEVLNQQSPDVLDFLLKTSILERMTGSLCTAVAGDSASPEILLQLERANMFLITLDDQRDWYRYHHLFADLLQKELQARRPDLLPELHRQASEWYAGAGFQSEAVTHALKTKDWDFAAARIEAYISTLIQHGEMTLARKWLDSLPDHAIRPRPVLCIAQAWTSARYANVELAEDLLVQAEAALSRDTSDAESLDPQVYDFVSRQIAVLQVVLARVRGDSIQSQQELALQAIDHLSPAQDLASQASLYLRLGLCYLDLGKDEQANRNFSQAFRLGRASGNHYAAQTASYCQMVIYRRHGKLHEIASLCREALDNSHLRDNQYESLAGIALTMLGIVHYEWNDLEQAEDLLVQGLKLVEGVGMAELLLKGYFSLACVNIAQGNLELPQDLIGIATSGNPALASYAAALQARLDLLLVGQNPDSKYEADVLRWAGTQQLSLRGQPAYDWEITEKLVYARTLCSRHQVRKDAGSFARLIEALDFIEGQRQPLEKLGWEGGLVEVYIVMAMILRALERKDEALAALERALLLAEPQGFARTFLDEGEPMRELLRQALSVKICRRYAQELLSAFEGVRKYSGSRAQAKQVDLIELLSERELQVLYLLRSHLSVPEIAREIHLAPTTVRTHVQNIYRKLDVHGRIEALDRAEELGLL